MTLDPSSVSRDVESFIQEVNVCYYNPCTGVNTCKIFSKMVPGRGTGGGIQWRINQNVSDEKLTIYPNPTNGNVKVILPEILTGNYQIFDQNSLLIQEGKFKNSKELEIELYKTA